MSSDPKAIPATLRIHPVGVDQLVAAHRKGEWDPRTQELLGEEFAALRPWLQSPRRVPHHTAPSLEQPREAPGTLMGLAVSGGGIRSATFALGALQRLAGHDLLQRFDYLSTVSGGGYIGSALTWWLNHAQPADAPAFGTEPEDFPFGTHDPADADAGQYGKAPPGKRKDSDDQRRVLRFLRRHGNYLTPGGCQNLVSGAAIAARGVFLSVLFWLLGFMWVMAGLRVASGLRVANGAVEGIHRTLTWPGQWEWFGRVLEFAGSLPPLFELGVWVAVAVFALLLVASVVYSVLSAARLSPATSYFWRRAQECWLKPAYGAIVVGLGLGLTAIVGQMVVAPGAWASGGVLAGLVAGLWTYLRSGSWRGGAVPVPVIATVGAALLLFGLLVIGYLLAAHLLALGWLWFAIAAALSLGYALLVNLNYVSIHRLYRDRLMEAYLPDWARLGDDRPPPARRANRGWLSQCWGSAPRGPYHLVNTNVVLVGSRDRTWRLRGGDSFVLSPLYCGSNATGWRATASYMGNKLSLATAMAISGAAANPNTGAGGAGLTRNPIVSALMTVLGVSLGFWAPNPRKWIPGSVTPNHLWPGAAALFPGCFQEHRSFLQLSDGGHFENLAVYELVRRRVRLILLLDGACDPDFAFADFQVLIRRIEADFGAQVFFDADNRLEMMMPKAEAGYPPAAKVARQGHLVGTIRYCDGTHGLLVYLKSTPIDRLSLKTKGYKAAHPGFPDQTTADQFFDEDQFEAYRELGYRLAQQMVESIAFKTPAETLSGLDALMAFVESGRLRELP